METDLASLPTLTAAELRVLCIKRGLPAANSLRKAVMVKSLEAWVAQKETEEASEEGREREDVLSNLHEEEDDCLTVISAARAPSRASGRGGSVVSDQEEADLDLREREPEAQVSLIALHAEKLALLKEKWARIEQRDGGSDREVEVSMGGGVCPRLPKGVIM
ncbi:hypothetical protein NDU88_002213 [Pleurodeles waltl]|uniref:SAP domain-containing protein n=1 Tax=Pleurodeles waltl TaxID=8319 RepID=A0AAV7Q983_PLEWA|nr:hypothetical protein NDU88_002213 [Pleurodeles waltl]